MTGMTTKTKQTSKSTKSVLKKPSRSSKTRTSSSKKIKDIGQNKDFGQSVRQKRAEPSRSFSAKTSTTLSASSQPANLPGKKSDVWAGYDYDEMPELGDAQLAGFKRVSPRKHKQLKAMVQRGRGRPPKEKGNKEIAVSMRLHPKMLDKLKKQAEEHGTGWQTYAKSLIQKGLSAN